MNNFHQNEIIKFHNLLYGDQFKFKMLNRTKRYLDYNFSEDISLSNLAVLQGFSKYHLLKLFKLYFGLTPR